MGNNTGSLRKIVLNGVTFDVPGDTNITFNNSKFTTEGMPTSGKTMFKMMRKVKTVESVELGTTPAEMEQIKELSEGLADITLSFELADGSVYKGKGRIDFESYESETGKTKIKLIPDGDWTPFLA
jgi:hypothetical protein